MGGGGNFQGGDEVVGQLFHIAALVLVKAPGVVFHRVFLQGAVGHALLPVVGPGEGRLDAVGGIVGEGQGNGAGGGDGQQVGIAQAVLADFGLDLVGQAGGKVAAGKVQLGVEEGEGAPFLGHFHGGQVGGVAHEFGNAGGHGPGFGPVVAQAQHGQGVAQAGEAEADAALVGGFFLLPFQGPVGGVQHVVQHAGGHLDHFTESVEVELGLFGEGVLDEQGQVDGTQAAAAVRRQGLFGAGVGGLDLLAVIEVVVLVDAVQEEDAGFGVVVGGLHHLVPQVPGPYLAIDPHAVLTLEGALGLHVGVGLGLVHQFHLAVGFHRLHEGIGDAQGDVEVGQVALVLGVDEVLDVRMVAAQHAHLGAAAGAGGFHGLAGAVEDAHVGDGAGGAGLGALDLGAHGADGGEVVADAATATHGLGGLGQGSVDAGAAVHHFDDGVADRLHEAVDQGGGEIGAGGGVDAAGGDETVFLGPEEFFFPLGPVLLVFDGGQGAGNAAAHVMHVHFLALGVLFHQHFGGDFLLGQRGKFGCFGNGGQGELFGDLIHGFPLQKCGYAVGNMPR